MHFNIIVSCLALLNLLLRQTSNRDTVVRCAAHALIYSGRFTGTPNNVSLNVRRTGLSPKPEENCDTHLPDTESDRNKNFSRPNKVSS